ncbi:MAG: trypsin-like serine protease [Acidimicrobiia bacterium]|nr:trypsin-like serine protease [Actinomycetota bacterium]MBL6923954.1 trypsin-like serine protease [Acidimicrobiia bacterium]
MESCGGDSGGPWFNNRTAYGVHSGSDNGSDCSASGTDYATFTAMDDVLRDLDLTFATN